MPDAPAAPDTVEIEVPEVPAREQKPPLNPDELYNPMQQDPYKRDFGGVGSRD